MVPGPAHTAARPAPARALPEEDYGQLLDEIPEDLLDELVGMLESEVERRPALAEKLGRSPATSAVADVMDEIGVGSSQREWWWAGWGFAIGFGANLALAKYAQMSANAPMGEFVGPMLIGGVVAGCACAAIGWGFAKLRE